MHAETILGLAPPLARWQLMPRINFLLRQSDEDLAVLTISESRTLLKLYLDEKDLAHLADEIEDARRHLKNCRSLNELVERNLKKTRFPRGKRKI